MNPQSVRKWLQFAGVVLGTATAIVMKLQEIDLTSRAAIIGAIGLVVGGLFGKAQEAPGGVPIWKIPEEIRSRVLK